MVVKDREVNSTNRKIFVTKKSREFVPEAMSLERGLFYCDKLVTNTCVPREKKISQLYCIEVVGAEERANKVQETGAR